MVKPETMCIGAIVSTSIIILIYYLHSVLVQVVN